MFSAFPTKRRPPGPLEREVDGKVGAFSLPLDGGAPRTQPPRLRLAGAVSVQRAGLDPLREPPHEDSALPPPSPLAAPNRGLLSGH